MSDALRAALDAGDAPAALRAALIWSAAAAAGASADPDDTVAVAAVIGLDDALTDARALADALPGLLEAAQLGPAVEAYLREQAAELAALGEAVAAARAEHEELIRTEDEQRERLEEHAELRAQVDELRRLERLVRALDELEPLRRHLDARLVALKGATADIEPGLERTGAQVLELSEAALAALTPETRELAERVTAAESELAAEEERRRRDEEALGAAEQRTRDLRALHEERTRSLAAHAALDRELAATLGALGELPPGPERNALERARVMLDEVAERLASIDGTLGDALARLEQTAQRERAPIPIGEAGPVI